MRNLPPEYEMPLVEENTPGSCMVWTRCLSFRVSVAGPFWLPMEHIVTPLWRQHLYSSGQQDEGMAWGMRQFE